MMFDQFKNLKNLAGLMGNAGEIRQRIERMQEELARKHVEADAGAGAVRVVVNGKLEVISVHLDRPLLIALAGQGSEVDQTMVEELIVSATNAALAKARELIQQEMARAAGGLNLPGLDKLMGGGGE